MSNSIKVKLIVGLVALVVILSTGRLVFSYEPIDEVHEELPSLEPLVGEEVEPFIVLSDESVLERLNRVRQEKGLRAVSSDERLDDFLLFDLDLMVAARDEGLYEETGFYRTILEGSGYPVLLDYFVSGSSNDLLDLFESGNTPLVTDVRLSRVGVQSIVGSFGQRKYVILAVVPFDHESRRELEVAVVAGINLVRHGMELPLLEPKEDLMLLARNGNDFVIEIVGERNALGVLRSLEEHLELLLSEVFVSIGVGVVRDRMDSLTWYILLGQ